jgi:hypothetical protein
VWALDFGFFLGFSIWLWLIVGIVRFCLSFFVGLPMYTTFLCILRGALRFFFYIYIIIYQKKKKFFGGFFFFFFFSFFSFLFFFCSIWF